MLVSSARQQRNLVGHTLARMKHSFLWANFNAWLEFTDASQWLKTKEGQCERLRVRCTAKRGLRTWQVRFSLLLLILLLLILLSCLPSTANAKDRGQRGRPSSSSSSSSLLACLNYTFLRSD